MRIVKIHEKDNVGVAVRALKKGMLISDGVSTLRLRQDLPPGHKVALADLQAGVPVIKYGGIIGHTTSPAAAGTWLHCHNLKTRLGTAAAYRYQPAQQTLIKAEQHFFKGYRRSDGRVGTRNEIWIISTVGCINGYAEKLAAEASARFKASNCDGIFAITHPYGCSQLGDDLENTQRILAGLAGHPNAGAILLVGLGCENNQLKCQLGHLAGKNTARLKHFNLQAVADEMSAGLNAIKTLFKAVSKDRRVDCPASDLVLGLKCGGSDAFSGITANPLVGTVADLLTSAKGTVILSEVPEMFGAEQLLMNRAASRAVFNDIVALIKNFKRYFTRHGQPVYENPSPGNKTGGITTLEEKSLGAVQKGGSSTITQVLDYGDVATRRGLVLLNSPGNDGVAATAMIAAGATMLLFTTGRGTPMGFPVPTVKISTTTCLSKHKPGWIDFDAGAGLNCTPFPELSRELFRLVLDVASGRRKTRNETNGYRAIAIWKKGVTL